jgi:UDP-N-acetylglucosamine transferase subunit ALG13
VIFATIGSMFPFDRMAKAVDDWLARNPGRDALIQIGSGRYEPVHGKWVRMMRPAEFNETVRRCELVVAHLGMGSIITAMQSQKPVILLPRQFALGEHTSDHQMHGVEWLQGRPGIWIADEVPDLHRLLDDYVAGNIRRPTDQAAQFASPELIANLRTFIHSGSGR